VELPLNELRQDTKTILRDVARGEKIVLKYRGKPAARLVPLEKKKNGASPDPFYSLTRIGVAKGNSLSNEQMDRLIYGG
jgi:prevent-host-death family protein